MAAARTLYERDCRVEVFERASVIGGHSRTEMLNGVIYEPNGAHIFHTSNARVSKFVQRFELTRPYAHKVISEVFLSPDDETGRFLSWPPQIDELRDLPIWPQVDAELSRLPASPAGDDFETYVISMMGPTLYELFIRDYTIKQWAMDPRELSSRFAPKRVELRSDGYRRLFRDRWEFFGIRGANDALDAVLLPVGVTTGAEIRLRDLDEMSQDFDGFIITVALDAFVESTESLAWRGIQMRSRYMPTDEPGTLVTPAYVVNRPSLRVPYTRTVETKHATGQQILGTVVSEEMPGAPKQHYPVLTIGETDYHRNLEFQSMIRESATRPVAFCGRLANYQYIDQDDAIQQGMDAAEELLDA